MPMKNIMNVSTGISLGSMNILIILIILIHEQGVKMWASWMVHGISALPRSLPYVSYPPGGSWGISFVRNKVFS